jgi:hypothetical protein
MTLPLALGPDTLLRRKATAEALTAAGFPTAEKTLATKATRGGGPPYRKYGASRSIGGVTRWHGQRAVSRPP